MLVELAGSERAARSELRRAAMWEAWRLWRRAGRAIAGAIYVVAMTLIYLATGPIAALGLRAVARPSKWQLPPPEAPEPEVVAELAKPVREASR